VAAVLDAGECRRVAARRFTPARMAEDYLRLYDEVLERTAPGRPVGAVPVPHAVPVEDGGRAGAPV
jgi:hypothetical protein